MAARAVLTTPGMNQPNYPGAGANPPPAGSRMPIPSGPAAASMSMPPATPLNVTEADRLIKILFDLAARQGITPNPFSGGAIGAEDVLGDISFLLRSIGALAGPDSPVYQAVGITSGENVFMGSYAAYKAFKRHDAATRIGDTGGQIESGVDAARGIAQSIGGGFYVGYRGMMIASDVTRVNVSLNATTALGRATFFLGFIGNIFFGVFYTLMGAVSGYNLYRSERLMHQINKRTEVGDVALFLLNKAYGDVHDRVKKLKNVSPDTQEYEKKQLENICAETIADQLSRCGSKLSKWALKDVARALFKELEKNPQARAEYLRVYREKLGLSLTELNGLDLSPMQLCGLHIAEAQRQARKEARLGRVVGGAAMQEIQAAYRKGLKERLLSNDPEVSRLARVEAAALEKTVRSALVKNRIIFGSLIVASVVGLAITVAFIGLFALPPAWIFALTILSVGLAVAFMTLDTYFWKSALDSTAPTPYDKAFVSVAMGILMASFVGSACLTFIAGFPLLPFIIATIIVALGIGVCIYTLVMLHQHGKTWKDEHPDLERIQQELNQPLDDRTKALFKKLSRDDRQAIRKAVHKPYLAVATANDANQQFIDQIMNNRYAREVVAAAQAAGSTAPIAADYSLLERAAKKTSKEFWERWHHSRQEIDKTRAMRATALVQALQTQKEQLLDAAPWVSAQFDVELRGLQHSMRMIRGDAELFRLLKADVHYMRMREQNGGQLQGAVTAARREATANTHHSPADIDQKRITQIWSNHNRSV